MFKQLSIEHLWFRWRVAPPAVFGFTFAAILIGVYLVYAALAKNPDLTPPFGHTLTPIAAMASCAVFFAIAVGLLNMQSWARLAHLLQPIWLELVIFVDQGGIPKSFVVSFDVISGFLWMAIYWWFMFRHQSGKAWFSGEYTSGD